MEAGPLWVCRSEPADVCKHWPDPRSSTQLHACACVCVARELRGQLSLSGCGGLSSSFGSSSAALAVFAFLTFLAVPLCSRAVAESPEERRKLRFTLKETR